MMTQRRGGYLLEIPILFVVVLATVVLLLPVLPPFWRKVLVVVAAAPVLYCLHYMIVAPGWSPHRDNRLPEVMRWLGFAIAVAVVVAAVATVVRS